MLRTRSRLSWYRCSRKTNENDIGYIGHDLLFERYKYRHFGIQGLTWSYERFKLWDSSMILNVFDNCIPDWLHVLFGPKQTWKDFMQRKKMGTGGGAGGAGAGGMTGGASRKSRRGQLVDSWVAIYGGGDEEEDSRNRNNQGSKKNTDRDSDEDDHPPSSPSGGSRKSLS